MQTPTPSTTLIQPRRSSAAGTDRGGIAMVLVATFAWSFAGLFTRSLTIDICTTVAWRSFAGGVLLFALWLLQRRSRALRDLATLRWPDWAAVLAGVVAQAAFSSCLFLTSVAHVAVIYALTPFIAALIAWWWLGEAIAASTMLAILVSTAGVVTVVAGSIGEGTIIGDALALVMTAAFAILIVLPKIHRDLRVAEAMFISSFITFALFLPLSHTRDVDLRNALLIGTYGAINLVLAYFIFIQGARRIPAATAGLIVTLEIALSPFWVWLAFGERIDPSTFVGGFIVFGAVVGHLVHARHAPADGGGADNRAASAT